MQSKNGFVSAYRFAVLNLLALWLVFGSTVAVTSLGTSFAVWAGLCGIQKTKSSSYSKWAPFFGTLLIVIVLMFFIFYKKHFDAVVLGEINPSETSGIGSMFQIVSTISFSYVTIRIFDLIRGVTWGQEKLINPVALSGYLAPFHMLIAGPISSYHNYVKMDLIKQQSPTVEHILRCANTITTGLLFKVVFAQSILIFRFGVDNTFEVLNFTDACLLFLYLYFDFGGYSLVALGVGRLLGVPTPINFDKPFLSKSVTEFWGRWHVSLGAFVKNNIYWPIQFWIARRVKSPKLVESLSLASMCASFSAVAIWHRLTPRFFIWGVATSVVMLLEKYVQDWIMSRSIPTREFISKIGIFFGPVYTLTLIVLTIWYLSFELANI